MLSLHRSDLFFVAKKKKYLGMLDRICTPRMKGLLPDVVGVDVHTQTIATTFK